MGCSPYFYFSIAVMAFGGIPKGYDEGGFSGSVNLISFRNDFQLTTEEWLNQSHSLANRLGNIRSFAVLGAAFGALLTLSLNGWMSRLNVYRTGVVVWTIGLLIQIFSSGMLGLLLFARLFSGLGMGVLTVACPVYIAEIAPARIRGISIAVYMVVLLFFLSAGFFINYAASVMLPPTHLQYRLVQAIPLAPVGVAFCACFFLHGTPRELLIRGNVLEAAIQLARLRGKSVESEEVREELQAILSHVEPRHTVVRTETTLRKRWRKLKTLCTNESMRKRTLLILLLQILAQWSGGNGITYIIPTVFQYAGIHQTSAALLTSGVYGLVKLFVTIIFAVVLIDVIGRRRCFISGLLLQLFGHVYLTVYTNLTHAGSDVPLKITPSASRGAVASVFIYAIGWSVGLCTIPYIYPVEIFPTSLRSNAMGLSMFSHWVCQFLVVKTSPLLLVTLNVWGGFLFFGSMCVVGLIVLTLMAPETRAVPLECIDQLFEEKWYKMGWARSHELRNQDSLTEPVEK